MLILATFYQNLMRLAVYIGKSGAELESRVAKLLDCLAAGGSQYYWVNPEEGIQENTDMVLSVGGDGTFLSVSKLVADSGIPVIGVNSGRVGFLSENRPEDVADALLSGDYTIEDIKMREKEESPKPPFCTATFQQEAASKLNLKVKDAMAVAQKLFEAGRITYMRTDDTSFAAEFLPILKSYIEGTYGKSTYTKPRVGKKQENGQEGHECLRVTDPAITPDVYVNMAANSLNQRVYR